MDNHGCLYIFCVLWALRYSDAFPDCCHVTMVRGGSHVTCSGCRLRVVPQDLPTDTTVLNLYNNHLNILHRDSFPKLPQLEVLDLQTNQLVSISSGTFDNLRNIEYLDLSDNKLDHLSMDSTIFQSLKKLKTLNILSNNFHLNKVSPEYVLSTISNIENLFMDIFEGFFFGDEFLNLTRLQKLVLSSTEKDGVSLYNTSFNGLKRSNITELSINAYIRKIENNFLSPFDNLMTLRLKTVGYALTVHDALRGLYAIRGKVMDSLSITGFGEKFSEGVDLMETDMLYLGTMCVKILTLANNAIEAIHFGAVMAWSSRTCLEKIDISFNRVPSPQFLTLLALFPALTHLQFAYMSDPSVGKRSILAANEQILFLPRHLIYFNMSHSGMSGPLINVTFAKDNNLQVVDISYSYKTPSCSYGLVNGLVHLTELNVSGVDCSNPNPRVLTEFPILSRLTARQCNLGNVLATNTSLFKGLYNLSFVDISLNNLNSLNDNLFDDQKQSLKYLVMAGNKMDQIPYKALKDLAVLEWIDLSYNAISSLQKSEYHVLDELNFKSGNFQIVLFGNTLVCSCENLDFISWIETTHVIYKKHDLMCLNPDGSYMKIGEFLESFDEFKDSCVSQFWLITSFSLTLVFFVFGVLIRETWRRSVWLRLVCRQPLEHTAFTNDIYISYCREDSSWVKNTFAPWLDEKGIEYCCEDKSFPLARDIADNIMDAIDCSRQTVFVVSCDFLKHVYTTFTLRLVNEYSYRDGRENMNLIILLNDIKESEFPKLVRTNWDIIRPLRWPNESNTSAHRKLANAKDLFWERLLKRIRQGRGQ